MHVKGINTHIPINILMRLVQENMQSIASASIHLTFTHVIYKIKQKRINKHPQNPIEIKILYL